MRKPLFSREDVVAAGLALVRREGMTQMTARRVADELESSTAPVYSNFESMEELGQAVLRRAVRELLRLMRQNHTGDEFLNLGVGLLKFAVDEPRLYAALFLEGHGDYDPAISALLILGVSIFPFIARTMAETVLGIKYDEDGIEFLNQQITQLLRRGISQ